ncbi:predicted protein [Histoplasma mississippiense (nom. inval.)]|uniref:predicted protein n=1 Tax=Ajellomyces capsulatus (strain NAm1 / WU24) TaxID=2059318 RepID=UPI000157B803|nr:predicted protein [Histoplasma mississippiense (nom. inval.)]EDN03480.1 predicted protein [Histoplasma mississippiense (nom. inval.)]
MADNVEMADPRNEGPTRGCRARLMSFGVEAHHDGAFRAGPEKPRVITGQFGVGNRS